MGLSNNAYTAGSLHFWTGDYDNARKFYKIAADLQTGSVASLASEARLAILDGRFEDAARLTFMRAQRYDDEYAYRDYLSWLFVSFGLSDDAWAGFNQLNSSLPNAQMWIATHVGHRIARKPWPELRNWLMSDPIRLAGPAERFALIQAVMLEQHRPGACPGSCGDDEEDRRAAYRPLAGGGEGQWVRHPSRSAHTRRHLYHFAAGPARGPAPAIQERRSSALPPLSCSPTPT